MPGTFHLGGFGRAILLRVLPGLAAIGASTLGESLIAGICLVLCVWSDVLVGWLAKKSGWSKQESHVQLEGFVDCVCFIWAPVAFVFSLCQERALVWSAPVFILAGIYRLARFNVEGTVRGGYRGMPVTYNGYWFPLAALAAHYLPPLQPVYLFCGLFLILALLMSSGRFVTPEL